GTGVATVADRPGAKGDETAVLPADHIPGVSPAIVIEPAGTVVDKPRRFPTPPTAVESPGTHHSLTTAHDALHDEEIERTRLFIKLGWMISIAAIGVVPLLPAPRAMQIAMIAAMAIGIVVSIGF